MKPFQKVLMTSVWTLFVLGMVSVIGAQWWRQQQQQQQTPEEQPAPISAETPMGPVPPFELVDQDNKAVSDKSLTGKPWIADFIFTHCAGPCPLMTQKMSALAKQIDSTDVHFISFSVDPQRDTPTVLKEYAQRNGADERWRFLTGEKATIEATSKGMLLALDTANEPITHSTKFVLVGPDGQIRKYYDSMSDQQLAALVRDAKELAAENK